MSRFSLQSPLLQAALRRPTTQLLPRCTPTAATPKPGAARTFSHLPTLRPTLSSQPSIFRTPNSTTTTQQLFAPTPSPNTLAACGETATTLDLLPKSSITSHPAFAGCAAQIRCGPRATMGGASRLVQKRRHGFVSRTKTIGGRKMLRRRLVKGRKRLGH